MKNDDLKGRFLAQVFWEEVEKIANAQPGPQLMGMEQESKEDETNIEIDEFEDSDKVSPVVGIVGTRIQKKDRKVRATPIHQPPPGYVFDPSKSSFVPNLQIPGWMTQSQQALAAAKQDGYAQAKKEELMQKSQREADKFIELRVAPEMPAPSSVPMPPQGVMGSPQPLSLPTQPSMQAPTPPNTQLPPRV